jgi:hypothetical protein
MVLVFVSLLQHVKYGIGISSNVYHGNNVRYDTQRSQQQPTFVCYGCNKPGHKIADCPNKIGKLISSADCLIGKCPIVTVDITEFKVRCLVDTNYMVLVFVSLLQHVKYGIRIC